MIEGKPARVAILLAATLLPPLAAGIAGITARTHGMGERIDAPEVALPRADRTPPSKRVAVIVAGNHGTEITDSLPLVELLAATGELDVRWVAPARVASPFATGLLQDAGLDFVPDLSFRAYEEVVGRAPDMILVPYLPRWHAEDAAVISWIRAHADPETAVVSICGGAELAAAAGLFDGHAATANQGFLARLPAAYPAVEWRRDVRFIRDGLRFSSGTLAAGMDATLAAIAAVLGPDAAARAVSATGYPHAGFQRDPKVPPASVRMEALLEVGYRWERTPISIALFDGVSEAEVAGLADGLAGTIGTEARSVGPRGGIRTRSGVALLSRPSLDGAAGVVITPGAAPGTFGYDAAIRAIARLRGEPVAAAVAEGLNYPPAHLGLASGSILDLSVAVRPIALALGGLFTALLLLRGPRRTTATPRRSVLAAITFGLLSGCFTQDRGVRPAVPTGAASADGLLVATDLDPDPDVVEVELVAEETSWEIAPGVVVRGWGYNGGVPGPTIEAKAGDTLVVHLVNRLPEATTIHWHGLRVPADQDGTEIVQRAVQPGERFVYRFVLPDAGTFWYHPHAHETVQMERGLYGAMVVHGADGVALDEDRVLVLDDVHLGEDGQIAPFGKYMERHDGREGEVHLINGKMEPALAIPAGQVARWRVVNAASARYVRLSLGGASFRVLASDGGLLEAPREAREALLTPGDRLELAVGPLAEGQELHIESLPYDRGTFDTELAAFGVLRAGPSRPSAARIPAALRTITPLVASPSAARPSREVLLGGRMTFANGMEFTINHEAHHHAEPVKVGELQVWDIVNEAPIDHPFHLHGFFFQVLSRDGVEVRERSWEDTANVPAKSRMRIAFDPDDRPGSWMYHCHILEHAANGMMAHFEVVR